MGCIWGTGRLASGRQGAPGGEAGEQAARLLQNGRLVEQGARAQLGGPARQQHRLQLLRSGHKPGAGGAMVQRGLCQPVQQALPVRLGAHVSYRECCSGNRVLGLSA